MNKISALFFIASLAGCSGVPKSKEDCEKTNWQREGSRAIAAGEPLAKAWNRLSSQCKAQGFAADQAAFERGWGVGFAAYCLPRNGLVQGRLGHAYQGICTPPQDAEFIRAYDLGRVLRKADQEYADAQGKARNAQRLAHDEKISPHERQQYARDAAVYANERDAAAGRVSSLEAVAAQQGWGLGR